MSESAFLEQRYTVEEVYKLYDDVRVANSSWTADTVENKRKVCELFTGPDPRVSHRLDLMDMRRCVEILSAYLDRVPSPAPPTFPDDPMEPLTDGTMPLPIDATPYEQRRATIAQKRNLVARLRKFTAWQGGTAAKRLKGRGNSAFSFKRTSGSTSNHCSGNPELTGS